MVETVEQAAVLLINGVQNERNLAPFVYDLNRKDWSAFEVICRLIEERRTMEADHQAFREKVSEAMLVLQKWVTPDASWERGNKTLTAELDDGRFVTFSDFILSPPVDPLVEAIKKALPMDLFEYGGTPRRDEVAEAIAQAVKIERTEA